MEHHSPFCQRITAENSAAENRGQQRSSVSATFPVETIGARFGPMTVKSLALSTFPLFFFRFFHLGLLESPPIIRCFSHAFIKTSTPMTSGHKEKGDTEDGLRWSTGVSRKKITFRSDERGHRCLFGYRVWPKLIRNSSTKIHQNYWQLAGVFVKPIHWMWDLGLNIPVKALIRIPMIG